MFYLNGREHISFFKKWLQTVLQVTHRGAHIISANSNQQNVPGAPVKPEDSPLISGSKIKWAVTNKLYYMQETQRGSEVFSIPPNNLLSAWIWRQLMKPACYTSILNQKFHNLYTGVKPQVYLGTGNWMAYNYRE